MQYVSKILKLITGIAFEPVVRQTETRHAAKEASWGRFVAMLFCQLCRANSLGEIEGGLKSCEGKLAHLGSAAPARSNSFYANAHRRWKLSDKVFHDLSETVAAEV
jgi:hypothetical protein